MATQERKNVPRKKVTMRDVAKLAGVSQSTVSRVLSGAVEPIPIGEETQQRVLAAVEELGYYPNLHAGSLRGQKSQMLAVMIADIANPFYQAMVRAIQDVADTYRYDVMIANTDHALENEKRFMESVIRRPVDGLYMTPYHLTDDDLEELMQRTGVKIAIVGQHIEHPLVDVAFGNDGAATEEVVRWLHAEKGHERIGFIGVMDNFSAALRRRQGYERALSAMGLTISSAYEQAGDWSPESGYRAMLALLALPTPPTAVFACNDLMAIGALEAIKQAGLRAPDDVAIVGFDDIPAASWISPRLTTVAQFPTEMGTRLTHALFERIQDKYDGPGRRFEVPCQLITRDSV